MKPKPYVGFTVEGFGFRALALEPLKRVSKKIRFGVEGFQKKTGVPLLGFIVIYVDILGFGFPNIQGPFLGVPIMRILAFGGLYCGSSDVWRIPYTNATISCIPVELPAPFPCKHGMPTGVRTCL